MACMLLLLSMSVSSIWAEGSPFMLNRNATLTEETTTLEECETSSYFSVGLLLAGIISARFGLWLSDLSISQTLQENVQEEHRGVIGGVQSSLNSIMNTIKFILVIALPDQETYGWLIMASYCFVSLGALFYASFVISELLRKLKNLTNNL